ncbi:MAG: carbohydrate kinase family protein [Anaerolineae bacterium]|nr:carbohydrate kinase family protein [Anaerolineae bacterium]
MSGERPFDLLVAGEINVDLILSGKRVRPEFGRERLLDDATLTLGSSSVIFACGAARLGLRVAFLGLVGKDAFGDFMLRGMEERGIDTSRVVRVDEPRTGITVSLSEPTDRAMLTYLGTIALLRGDMVGDADLAAARHLHLTTVFLQTGLLPGAAALMRRARRQGCTTSLDTGWDPDDRWNGQVRSALLETDVLLPNEEEAPRLAGTATPEEALEGLAARIPVVAVKLGARGALGAAGSTRAACSGHPVTVVDTTGAGDSFDAGFLYGYLHDWSLERSLRLGCACGSLSTRAAGGTPAQPTLAEALALMGEGK